MTRKLLKHSVMALGAFVFVLLVLEAINSDAAVHMAGTIYCHHSGETTICEP